MKKIMHSLFFYLFYVKMWILSWWPFAWLYLLSDLVLFPFLYYVIRYRRHIVRQNLVHSFPEKTEKELKKLEKQFYHHFCDYGVELIKLMHISQKELDKRMTLPNIELFYEQLNQGRNVILIMGHYANWDWLNVLSRKLHPDTTMAVVYRPLKDSLFDQFFLNIRNRYNIYNIKKNNTLRDIIRLKQTKKPFVVAMVSDQSPSRNNLTYWTTFLHQQTAVLTGMSRIAKQMHYAVYYIDMKKVKRGYYTSTISILAEDASNWSEEAISELFIRRLEETIQRDPSQYLWTHNRWKHSPPGIKINP
ncbi:MAG: lysophospholipid acyltransferase family protein [Microbacter sp.]